MREYFQILYVNTSSTERSDHLPLGLQIIRDWCWQHSARVRWSISDRSNIQELLSTCQLVVLDWSYIDSEYAREAYVTIRESDLGIPLLLIVSEVGRDLLR